MGWTASRYRIVPPHTPPWIAGRFYVAGPPFSRGLISAAASNDPYTVFCPVYVPNDVTIISASVELITFGGAATIRLGIYTADEAGRPDELLSDFGTLAIASLGVKTISPLAVYTRAGLYWAAMGLHTANQLFRMIAAGNGFLGYTGDAPVPAAFIYAPGLVYDVTNGFPKHARTMQEGATSQTWSDVAPRIMLGV